MFLFLILSIDITKNVLVYAKNFPETVPILRDGKLISEFEVSVSYIFLFFPSFSYLHFVYSLVDKRGADNIEEDVCKYQHGTSCSRREAVQKRTKLGLWHATR